MSNEKLTDYGDVLTVDEVIKYLRIGRNSAYTLLKSGKLKSIRIGRQHRIPKSYITEFLEHQDNSVSMDHTADTGIIEHTLTL